MSTQQRTIFLSAAEASGDEHASNLIRAIRDRAGDSVRFVGAAGEKMAAAGCEVLADLTRRATMIGGPVLQAGYYLRMVRRLRRAIRRLRPDLHIPVDSPALNWHLAAGAKDCGAKVLYYIAPQVWAWAPWRVRKLARLTDHVACILPFEERYLWDRGVEATYVGHPLFDTLPDRPDPPPDLADAWARGTWRVALLPGSRPGEIRNHTPALFAAAERIRRRWPGTACTFTARTERCAEAIRAGCGRQAGGPAADGIEIAVGRTRHVLAEAHLAVAVSGTVTLEAAHFGVPMVIFYRASRLAYLLVGRWLLRRTPNLSLVNILAGRKIVPEIMPWHGSARRLIDVVMEVMDDVGWLFETREDLVRLVEPLRCPPPQTASGNAAEIALRMLGLA
jgi:lipid-A-disaccharide synthase